MNPRQKAPYAEYNEEADAIYVWLTDAKTVRSAPLDDFRNLDFSADGAVVGVEFIDVSGGVDLEDIPHKQRVEQLIGDLGLGIKIFA
jgi:uncharacterized protein YuzE